MRLTDGQTDEFVASPRLQSMLHGKNGSRMQNDMPIMIIRSKSYPEFEFQYSGCLFTNVELHNRYTCIYIVRVFRYLAWLRQRSGPT